MNTHPEHHHHGYQANELPAAQPEVEASDLGRHSDPSLAAHGSAPFTPRKQVTWVRPTELAPYAGPVVGRGIDLQAELARRTRRAPVTATRTSRHMALPTTPPPGANRTEGLQL